MTEDKYVTNAESTSVYSGMEIQEDVLKLRIEKKVELTEENEQLKAQIEKMKCCYNCEHYTWNMSNKKCQFRYESRKACDNWGLAECLARTTK